MKKAISLSIIVFMLVALLCSCAGGAGESTAAGTSSAAGGDASVSAAPESSTEPEAEKAVIRIAGLKGPTSIGMVSLMEKSEKGETENKYEFTVAGAADEITPKLIKGELDAAAIPCNLASVLHNNTKGNIRILAVNTLSVLYIVTKNTDISSVEDLRGKTIYSTGKGTTPEYTLRYVLGGNGIDPDKDVTVDFKSEATEVVAALSAAESGIAMLPQPYVTVAAGKVEGLKIALDIGAEWKKLDSESEVVTGVLAVRADFADEHPEEVAKLLEEYAASVSAVNGDTDAAAELVEKFGLFKAAIAKAAIPKCNIVFISGDEMKTPVTKYLTVLYEQNAKAIGGKLPGDELFLIP